MVPRVILEHREIPAIPLFLTMTLGPVLIELWAFERRLPGWRGDPLDMLGRVPLFFYVLHLYALWIFGFAAAGLVWGLANLGPPPQPSAPNWPLGAVWGIWIVAMILFLPPTRWFADLNWRSERWWMSYLWGASAINIRGCGRPRGEGLHRL